jgi:coatomer protein complex subunit epsilon
MSKQQNTQVLGHHALLPIKNLLYLGNFGGAISKASQVSIDASDEDAKTARVEKDVLLYRAHIGLQQYDLVLDEIKDSDQTPLPLRVVRLLAQYCKSQDKQSCVDKLDAWFSDPSCAADPTLASIAATIYAHEGNYIAALKAVHNPTTLEMASLQVTSLLQINRLDLAQDALKNMIEMNDDATITQLTSAYVALVKGGAEQLQEASNIFEELTEKFGESVLLLNGIANCQLLNGQFQEAESTLLNALAKKSNDPETLVNLIVVSQHLKKPKDTVTRYINQLKAADPNHPWLKNLADIDVQFGKFATQYKAKQ